MTPTTTDTHARTATARCLGLLLLAAACGEAGGPRPAATPSTSTATTSTWTAPAPATTLGPAPERGVFVVGEGGTVLLDAPDGIPARRIRDGVLLPYSQRQGRFVAVTTPCGDTGWADLADGVATGPHRVVIDPGHGGDEPGATGPSGLTEAVVNLDVAGATVDLLAANGIPAVLTRTADYRATLAFRVEVALDASAEVFVSIHHNAEPDEQRDTPGSEAYYQFRSADSRRLTGLVYEEVYGAYSAYDVTFAADFDAGAKYRLTADQRDYYGIVRRTYQAGIAATLLESGFISNPQEETLLRNSAVRRKEAEAIARAIERYFAGEQPGDVFTEPYPRTQPAGPGGGPEGCVDPA